MLLAACGGVRSRGKLGCEDEKIYGQTRARKRKISVSESDRIRQSLEHLFKKSRQLRENVDKKQEEASKLNSAISKRRKHQEKDEEEGNAEEREDEKSSDSLDSSDSSA
jgi:hypothetical protein